MPGDRRGHTPVQPAAPWPQPRRRQTPSPPWPRGWAPPRAPPARFRGGHAGRTLPLPGLTSWNTWPARGRGRSGGARSETPKVGGCARSAGRWLRPGRAPSAPARLVRSVPPTGETRSHLVCHPPPTSLPPRQEDEAEMSSRDRSQPRAGVAAPHCGARRGLLGLTHGGRRQTCAQREKTSDPRGLAEPGGGRGIGRSRAKSVMSTMRRRVHTCHCEGHTFS